MPPRNSRMTDAWVQQACAANPIAEVLGDDGKPTGLYRTGPVRLTFPNLLKPSKSKDDPPEKEAKFNTGIIWPKGVDLSVIQNALIARAYAVWPDRWNGTQFAALHFPIHDGFDKQHRWPGYEQGSMYCNVTSKFKPQVVAMTPNGLQPVVDESKIYGGVWAILTVNVYDYHDKRKQGVSLGLGNCLIIADDERLGGGGSDAATDFKGVQVDATTDFSAAMSQMPNTMPGAPPAPIMPTTTHMPPAPAAPLPTAPLPGSDEELRQLLG